MEEQEESDIPKVAWYDRGFAKGANIIFAAIGVLATVAGVIFTIYSFSKEPTTSITATYQEAYFVVPERLKSTGRIDSAIDERDTRLKQISHALRERIGFREALSLPDSLQPYNLHSAYSGRGQIREFAFQHSYFYILTIKNDGEKTIDKIHLIHSTKAYYEYKDGSGASHQGESASNLPLGDLAPTEVREVYLWTQSRLHLASGLTVTYDTGKVQAVAVSVDGAPVEEVKTLSEKILRFIPFILGILVLRFLYGLFKLLSRA